ncbi:MAG: hypothetical protein FVQ79_10855 [Planctomycetes bacterium]|nr:hypothetical protein [Planctomycetota bacterium]
MSETEVKEAVENDVTEEPKSYTEEQFKGLLADKQAEVKKRQDLEKQVQELVSKQKEAPPSGTSEGSSGSDDDAPMTVGQFRKMMGDAKQADAETRFAALEDESTQTAGAKFTAQSQGDGLDFESVIAAGENHLTEGDLLAIRQAKDPAAEKYRRCVFNTPELSEKAETVRTSKLLEEIKLTGRVPASGGVETSVAAGDVDSMSEEELDKLAEALD